MKRWWLLAALWLTLSDAAASPLLYDFALYGPGVPSNAFSFSLPSTLAPDFVAADGSSFRLDNVRYRQGGFSPCPCVGSFTFFVSGLGEDGGVAVPGAYFVGPQLFTGPASAPVFTLGHFFAAYSNPASFYDGGQAEIFITASPLNPVPEAATWLTMLAAVALLFGAARRSGAALWPAPPPPCAGPVSSSRAVSQKGDDRS